MKKYQLLLVFSVLTMFGFSQEFSSQIQGKFEILPNAKISYPFNIVKIDKNVISLMNSDQIVQVLMLKEDQKDNVYLVEQISPVPVTEDDKFKATMNIKVAQNENGTISVNVYGNKNHGSFLLKLLK
ncbi:MAG: hypothetical protein V4638_02260 [Bacteroidota bacterium]